MCVALGRWTQVFISNVASNFFLDLADFRMRAWDRQRSASPWVGWPARYILFFTMESLILAQDER